MHVIFRGCWRWPNPPPPKIDQYITVALYNRGIESIDLTDIVHLNPPKRTHFETAGLGTGALHWGKHRDGAVLDPGEMIAV